MRSLLLGILLSATGATAMDLHALERKLAQFARVRLEADVSLLPANERQALARIVEASRLMDAIFLRQVWAGNEALLLRLTQDETPEGRARLRYFLVHRGPWDRQDHERAFVPGVPARSGAAGFYPDDATRAEVEAWIAKLSPEEREKATSFFTTIRRDGAGSLHAVPYAVEYGEELAAAARLLREAADLTAQPTLRTYLRGRAAAFLSNEYRQSDVDWMKLDATIEPTIGPYEVYEDGWFNYKAAFESFVALRDEKETQKLARFSGELQDIEDHLPIDPAFRNPALGALAPIRVVNVIFTAGDANHGVQTAAFNLPNDEVVTKQMGSKRVMLRNVQQAKFERVLQPIAAIALSPQDRSRVAFDPFFTWILMHELMHGLGPHDITVDGRRTTVRKEMKELGSALEEAKADISGLWALQRLLDRGVIDASMRRTLFPTYLASAFRSLRFGIGEAHGRGTALQMNWLLDHGAVAVAEDGTFHVVEARMGPAVEGLTRTIMTLQAHGDHAGARVLLDDMAVIRPQVQRVLDRLAGVPVDIAPVYVTADALSAAPPAPPSGAARP